MRKSYIYPDKKQKELLRILFSSNKVFKVLWPKWKKQVGEYQKLEQGTTQLFPILYQRLIKNYPDDSWIKVLQNSYKAHWLKNQLLLNSASEVCRIFTKKKIPFLITKGGAYIYLYYDRTIATRRIEDIDIVVSPSDFYTCIKLLKKQGWSISEGQNLKVFRPDFFHSIGLKKGPGRIDLHCHILHFYLKADDRTIAQENKQSFFFGKEKAFTLSDTFHFLHTCLHGLRSHGSIQLLWIVDAHLILKQGKVDWAKLLELCQQLNCAWPILTALSYLKSESGLKVPSSVFIALRKLPTPYPYKRLYELHTREIDNSILTSMEVYWWTYVNSLNGEPSPLSWVSQLYRYIQFLSQSSEPLKMIQNFVRLSLNLVMRSLRDK